MGFPSNLLTELPSGSEGAYSNVVGIQTAQYTPPAAAIIPPELRIFEISYFSEPGKIQEIFKKRNLHVTVDS